MKPDKIILLVMMLCVAVSSLSLNAANQADISNSNQEISWDSDPDNFTSETSNAAMYWTVRTKDATTRFTLEYDVICETPSCSSQQSWPVIEIPMSSKGGQPFSIKCGKRPAMKPLEIIAPETNHAIPIPIKVTPGTSIRIQGQPDAVGWFDINFINGTSSTLEENRVFLHIRANRLQPAGLGVHLNSYIAKKWGTQEGPQQKKIFASHQFFDILITATPEHFVVIINGLHFANYEYRGEGLAGISHLLLRPGATYYKVRFEDSAELNRDQMKLLDLLVKTMPKPQNDTHLISSQVQNIPPENEAKCECNVLKTSHDNCEVTPIEILNPKPDYIASIPCKVEPGLSIRVQGRMLEDWNNFTINLMNGSIPTYNMDDILLHVNPRYFQGQIICNSRFNGSWGLEETKVPEFALAAGQFIDVVILLTETHFEIILNGEHFANYNHRSDWKKISHLWVAWGVKVYRVRYEHSLVYQLDAISKSEKLYLSDHVDYAPSSEERDY